MSDRTKQKIQQAHLKWQITLECKAVGIKRILRICLYLCSAPHTSDPSLEMSVLLKL